MAKYGFGVDLGGTTCKIGLFETNGTMVERWEIPTDTRNQGSNILHDITEAIHKKIAERGISEVDVVGIGIGVPGPVTADGVVHGCVNLGWGEIALDDELTKLSGFPVVVGNDANVAALGESWMGAGKDCSSVVVVTLGTGIGGGIVIDGKLLPGAHGAGGEIGHIVVNREETERCNCGLFGCIEQYTSATGIVRVARKHLTETQEDSTLRSEENISAKTVFDAARDGDKVALDIIQDVCGKLGLTLARISAVVDPEVFLLGGGVSRAGQILLDEVEKAYKRYVFQGCTNTRIALASLGNDAGMYGSAKLIFDEVLPPEKKPSKKKVVVDA